MLPSILLPQATSPPPLQKHQLLNLDSLTLAVFYSYPDSSAVLILTEKNDRRTVAIEIPSFDRAKQVSQALAVAVFSPCFATQ